jgi:serine/threonine protein kinase
VAEQPATSLAEARGAARLGRALASPAGVLAIVPLLVTAAGVTVLLLGRRATLDTTDTMARRQLAQQAGGVRRDVAFALDQAAPLLVSLRAFDADAPIEVVAVKLRDLVIGRPGIANVSIAFPRGVMRGTYIDAKTGEIRVQESIIGASGTVRTNYRVVAGRAAVVDRETTSYDPRTRPHYTLAVANKARLWMQPRTFFTSHKTGLTITEPIYELDRTTLRAVTTVDFDVTELSASAVRAPLEGARTIVFAGDGTMLAFPSMATPAVAARENRLLRHEDFHDAALESLFAELGARPPVRELEFLTLRSSAGDFLASVAPIGGSHAGVTSPLDWYLATLVPEDLVLGPTRKLELQSLYASAGALAIAIVVALAFAWNVVRMRRAVGDARERVRSAQQRAKELGSYRLVARVGAGGMGEVWRAEHRLLARQSAIKLVRPEALSDPRHAPRVHERFRREAQTLASMRSRHTISLHDYGVTDDGTFFYVMELVDGIDLDKLVRKHGPLPAARAIHLLVQACHSLAEAHDAGLLHRDIKPANLMTCRAADEVDVLKVLDFGIVRTVGEDADPLETIALPPAKSTSGKLTQVGAVVGTPGYIAPEQLVQNPIDARSDLYALGCVAWWLLVGAELFPLATEQDKLAAHLSEPPPPLAERVTGWLPDELARVVASLLAKRPNDRPHDARALAAALRVIAIPAEHAWTDERAQAWWLEHRPPSAAPRRDDPSSETRDLRIDRLAVPRIGENDATHVGAVAVGEAPKTS